MRTVRHRTALCVLAAATSLLAGCGGTVQEQAAGGTPTPTPTTTATALPTSLSAARAAWRAAQPHEYTLRVERSCFCVRVVVTSTVSGGTVTHTDVTQPDGSTGATPPAGDTPRTVEELFALVEKHTGERLDVVYSPQGVPLSVAGDPLPNAADDEFAYTVSLSTSAGSARPAPDGSWTKAPLPAGVSFSGPEDGGPDGARAVVVREGGAVRVHLALWGSSSCPRKPVSLRPAGVRTTQAGPVQVFAVDVDATPPAEMCTADIGPTSYVATLPGVSGGAKTPPMVQLVTTEVRAGSAAPTTAAFLVTALPS